jgi:glycosyltransferase involved in cell wall biosynthesis
MKLLFSLVLATVHREAELERCLASLCLDGHDDFEVFIVDQNTGNGVQPIAARFQDRLRIIYLHQAIPAASSARNFGAEHASGEWIGFPDDDVQFLPGTLLALRRHIHSGACDVISGMTCDESGKPSVASWRRVETPMTRRHLRSTVAESTLFLRRDLFLRNNGFDVLFGPGGPFGAEEAIDLVRRLQQTVPVHRMRFFPDICLIHANSIPYENQAALQKSRSYARARGACFARHWRSASRRRLLSEVSRHAIGSLVLRGLRRRSRIDCLRGYVEGFRAYREMLRKDSVPARSLHHSVESKSIRF